jgi:hypothetical protein
MGMLLVFLSLMNTLIDTYTVFAASVLAANSVLRSLFGTGMYNSQLLSSGTLTDSGFNLAFPLFTGPMYRNLGVHWASAVSLLFSGLSGRLLS